MIEPKRAVVLEYRASIVSEILPAFVGGAPPRMLELIAQPPTLVIVGREDALTPPELAQEIANGIPGAKLEIIPDCGHLSTLERPEAVNRAMRAWLTA